ncbi:MAG TPA: outer membrane beta-barrel protein [Candidatus Acidoferrum sp.]|nr:outer membrane beta-barrel protein [Candidatus Acidoferrum sp.]
MIYQTNNRVLLPCLSKMASRATAGILIRALFLLLAVGAYRASLFAQTYSRLEIGVQGASLRLVDPVDPADEKGGFGARITYNTTPILAWDAEGDFFPVMSEPGWQRGGRAFMLVAGPKAGWRWQRIGIFLKARPGVMNFSNVVRVETGILPSGEPYVNIFPGGHLTHLALDLGGTLEINASRHTFIRFDVSEMLLRYGDRTYPIPDTQGASIQARGVIGDSLLVSAGFSYRLGRLDDQSISVQSTRRWEIGGQYGVLSLGSAKVEDTSSFTPWSLGDYPGFGGRLTYNFNRWLAMDSALNYFYTDPHVGDAQRGGKILQGSFGPKAGIHARRFGVFAKVRPGFLSYGGVHDNYFPPYPTTRLTHFAVDFGGILEYYPSRRTMLRFDLSRTAVFYGSTLVVAPQTPPFNGNFVDRGFRDNGMQFTTGFGWRF